ncbi:ABC transporter substrate-binding protein [Halomonas sp. HAL1]|uniref:ABC transporter substrate-binding protein n=1 Tax=Halomonas sp. HAL1 TaxID=550984 RepID=UPI00022D3038|nr:ABC transporter substrate-binding protein [Halomonas sp. HAL1]EHA13637.1 extracellular ligand-binding receptor [Halomonas sp. HAL1]WKV91615.1 ABC transporter substrate-binding protein [Halomonas sp. HAL1]
MIKNNKVKIGFSVALSSLLFSGYVVAADPLKIGIPTAESGAYADLGEQVKRAVNFAVEQANESGGIDGRKVEVSFLDTQGKAAEARRQSERLINSGYNILLGGIASGEALAVAPLLNRWDAMYISTIQKADQITGENCDSRLFRVNHATASDIVVVNRWIEKRDESSWALVASDTAWGRNNADSFKAALPKFGKDVVSEDYVGLGTNDMAPYIQKAIQSGAEGVWVVLAGRDAVNFINQASSLGLQENSTLAGVSFATDSTINAVGDIAEGVFGIINYGSTLDTDENNNFVKEWAEVYQDSVPTNFEGETYAGMQVLFQAVENSGSVEPSDISAAMSGGDFNTIFGDVLIRSEDHQLVKPNYFGVVGYDNDVLKPIINMTLDSETATPIVGGCNL